jgi:hypothetical protein
MELRLYSPGRSRRGTNQVLVPEAHGVYIDAT